MPSPRRGLVIAQPLFVVLAFVLVGLLLRGQWTVLRTYEWQIRPQWLLVSAVCIVTGWLIEIRMWQRLLALLGGRLNYRSAIRIWFTSTIVRYIPGNIWQPLSLTMLGRERGIRPEATVASLSLFQLIHLMGAGPIAAIYLSTSGSTSGLSYWMGTLSPWWSLVVAFPVVFFLVRPRSMLAIANAILSKAGREPLSFALSTRQLLRVLATSCGAWIFFAAGFTALAAAVVPNLNMSSDGALPHLLAAYPIAFVVGFVSLLTPGGLLVREGMLFLLLAPVVGKEGALVIAVAMRVWEVGLDAVAAAIAIVVPWFTGGR
jgi:glycosyltransferase 2 family protein